jgi:hypothetical protein
MMLCSDFRCADKASGSIQKIHNRLEKLFRFVDVNPVTGLGQGRDLGLRKYLADQWGIIIFNVIRPGPPDE